MDDNLSIMAGNPFPRSLHEPFTVHAAPPSPGMDSDQNSALLESQSEREIARLKINDRPERRRERPKPPADKRSKQGNGPVLIYSRRPDGRLFTVEGEIIVDDDPPEDDPQAALNHAAPTQPTTSNPLDTSPQDYSLAARSAILAQQAAHDLARQEDV